MPRPSWRMRRVVMTSWCSPGTPPVGVVTLKTMRMSCTQDQLRTSHPHNIAHPSHQNHTPPSLQNHVHLFLPNQGECVCVFVKERVSRDRESVLEWERNVINIPPSLCCSLLHKSAEQEEDIYGNAEHLRRGGARGNAGRRWEAYWKSQTIFRGLRPPKS